jgi:hypothetical protein
MFIAKISRKNWSAQLLCSVFDLNTFKENALYAAAQ